MQHGTFFKSIFYFSINSNGKMSENNLDILIGISVVHIRALKTGMFMFYLTEL